MSTETKRAEPNAYSRPLGRMDLPRGGVAVMERPRATVQAAYLEQTPHLTGAINKARLLYAIEAVERAIEVIEAAPEPEPEPETDPVKLAATLEEYREMHDQLTARAEALDIERGTEEVSAVTPSEELSASCAYLAQHTRAIEGVDEVNWAEMDAAERADWYDKLGHSELVSLVARMSSMVSNDSAPKKKTEG